MFVYFQTSNWTLTKSASLVQQRMGSARTAEYFREETMVDDTLIYKDLNAHEIQVFQNMVVSCKTIVFLNIIPFS